MADFEKGDRVKFPLHCGDGYHYGTIASIHPDGYVLQLYSDGFYKIPKKAATLVYNGEKEDATCSNVCKMGGHCPIKFAGSLYMEPWQI